MLRPSAAALGPEHGQIVCACPHVVNSPASPPDSSSSQAGSSDAATGTPPTCQSHAQQRKREQAHTPLFMPRGSRWPGQLPPAAMALIPVSLHDPGPASSGAAAPRKGTFRYWVDYQVLSSPESATLLERALQAVGGMRTGGPPKLDPITAAVQKHKDYGYMHMDEWDFLWSITAKAMLAAEVLRPGQLVSIIPGFLSITRKTSLVRNLRLVYGDHVAFRLVPLTFKLPEELDEWSDWLKANDRGGQGLWMLKNNKQRGTGLRLVHGYEAFDACFETTSRPGLEGMMLYRWYLAQQYIANPLLISGRKFGIRVWALIPGITPMRAYIHVNGLVLFSSHTYNNDTTAAQDGSVAPGHVTNYAHNENGDVWSLVQLAAHLGQARWRTLISTIQATTAMVFAAALPRVKEVQAQMSLPPRSCFQFFGLDYLVDEALKPWLLETNATPSMKVEHSDMGLKRLIHDQKWPVIKDTISMLEVGPERFKNPPTSEYKSLSFLSGELERRGGYLPLMHLFPEETPDGLSVIPWSPLDKQLRSWVRSSSQYQAAIASMAPA